MRQEYPKAVSVVHDPPVVSGPPRPAKVRIGPNKTVVSRVGSAILREQVQTRDEVRRGCGLGAG